MAKMSLEKKVLTTLAVGAGGFLLYYLVSGAGSEKKSPLIPDSIEEKLDAVVDALNTKMGKDWAIWGIRLLEGALSKSLPLPLTALIAVVHQAEKIGSEQNLSGQQKRTVAAEIARASKPA